MLKLRYPIPACAFLLCAPGSAAAQAPIEYPGSVQVASVEGALTGGDDTSYGYGRDRTGTGAAIDLRRSRSSEASNAPGWLEQERVGPPYEANGQWYVPTPEPGYEQTGTASWYGPTFHGQATASGEIFDQEALTAAHPTLPINSLVQVTNLANGREVIVRVNDRGPFVGGRLIDLSRRSAQVLGFEGAGHARVHVRYLGPAPRRVDANGAVPAPSPTPASARLAGEGPVSLLPASVDSEDTELAGAPLAPVRAAYTPPAPIAGGGFYVQLGAFSDLTNAHRVRDAVSAAGPVTVDVRNTASGGELFRVRLGPWQSREQAEAARRQLASLGYAESIVAAR